MATEEKHEFKAEIKKLLNILSKSLYQHKEIFLRELISNASDALQKIQFVALQNKDIQSPNLPYEINITIDPKNKWMMISDTGIGMNKEELTSNLGTIAGSGSEKFMAKLKESKDDKGTPIDLDIIGQFGVGFYSVFMVADKVKVTSKSYLKDEPAYQWESEGAGDFVLNPADKAERGTDIVLYFKDDETEFLSKYQVENIIKKYSNFVPFPIFVTEIEEPKKVVDMEEEGDKKEGEKKEEEKKEGEESKLDEEKKEPERKSVNEIEPLWKKSPSNITDEQYKTFYSYISKRYDNYAFKIHYKAEGRVEFKAIIYIPETKSNDLFRPETEFGLSLYSRNVMIMEHCKELLPQWMRFIVGVVESEDISLNISRETIQTDRVIMKINEVLVKKIMSELTKLAESEPDTYKKIWSQFGTLIKEGVVTDYKNKDELMKFIRVKTNKTKGEEMISLDQYIKNAGPDQKDIYYLVGENIETMRLSPHLGYYTQKGIEVVFFDEPVDNFLMMNVHDFKIKVPKSVTEENKEGEKKEDEAKEPEMEEKSYPFKAIDVTDKEESKDKDKDKKQEDKDKEKKEEEKEPEVSEDKKKFLEFVKKLLGGKITEAKFSSKLYGNICRLANPSTGMSSSMQRAMRYWSMSNQGKSFEIPKKILEFSTDHPVVNNLVELNLKSPDSEKLKAVVKQLFENCLLSEGDLPNPSLMVPRINQLIEMMMTGKDDVKNPVDDLKIDETPTAPDLDMDEDIPDEEPEDEKSEKESVKEEKPSEEKKTD